MDTRKDDFVNVNTNKRKAHVWISSLTQGVPGSAEIPASPFSSQLYDIKIDPTGMPKYSKYTVQVKNFQINPVNTAAFTPNTAPIWTQQYVDEDGLAVQGAFIDIEGLPVELNYLPDTLEAAQARSNQRLGTAFASFDGAYSHAGYCGTTSPDQPKIVVGRGILGNNQIRISILSQSTFGLVIGRKAHGAGAGAVVALPLPTFAMCLEIEGVDGFEDEPRHQFTLGANPTNGLGTGYQQNFQDDHKKKHFNQIGY